MVPQKPNTNGQPGNYPPMCPPRTRRFVLHDHGCGREVVPKTEVGCEGCCCARATGGWVGQWFDVVVTIAVCCRCIRSTAARKRSRQLCARCPLSRPRNPLRGSRPDRMAAALERSPEGFSWQSLVLERELRARHRSEIIFDACSACRVCASTPQAFVQPRRVYLPPSGAGSRQGLWRLPRSVP